MTDDAPELSNARANLTLSGDEPVLAGVNSKLIADRTGAYRAANLIALIEMMSGEQRMAFRRWNVQMALRRAKRVIHLYEREVSDNQEPQRAIDIAQRWLTNSDDLLRLDARVAANLATRSTPTSSTAARAAALTAAFTAKAIAYEEDKYSAWNAALAPTYAARALFAASFRGNTPTLKDWGRWRARRNTEADPHWLASRRAQLRAAYIILQRGEPNG